LEPKRQQSITRHPLFPAIVALWFAALLGLGSFALSLPAIEQLVLSAHIDTLIPAAAPPLGMTARLVLVIALGAIGGLAGWLLALRVGRPTPAAAPSVFNVADVGFDSPVARADLRPLARPLAGPSVEPPPPQMDGPVLVPAPPPVIVAPPAPRPMTAAERIASADLADLSHVELIERLAIAIRRREELSAAKPSDIAAPSDSVVRFPDLTDRHVARLAPPPPRQAPYETEKALRDALAALQRMSGG
jgi:hypothetical protein